MHASRAGLALGAAGAILYTLFQSPSPIQAGFLASQPPSNFRGILCMLMAMGVFIASDTCMKLAMGEVPLFQLMLMRGVAATSMALIMVVAMGAARHITRAIHPLLVARGLCEVVANFAFTLAILHMAIADVTAIAQTCPLLVLLGGWLFWGEKLGPLRLLLVAAGIAGALLVAQPGATAASPFALLGFLTALAAAGRDLITRKVPAAIPAPVVAFTVIVILTIAGGIAMLLFEEPVQPGLKHVALMIGAGALLVGGHTLIFMAYKLGTPRAVAPFMYSLTIWAVLAGLIVFNDRPNALAIAGMATVVIAGLLIILTEGRERRVT